MRAFFSKFELLNEDQSVFFFEKLKYCRSQKVVQINGQVKNKNGKITITRPNCALNKRKI